MPSKSDQDLGDLAIQHGFCTQQRIEQCLAIQADLERSFRKPSSLDRVLFNKGYLSREQVESLQEEQGRRICLCPVCDTKINIVRIAVGKKVRCPKCDRRRIVPNGFFPEYLLTEEEIQATQTLSSMGGQGSRIAGFELLGELGRGAMGIVYKARQISLDRIVAVKILTGNILASPDDLKRFFREAKAGMKINHENVVRTIDVGEVNGLHWISMEFVEGETLKKMLERKKAVESMECLRYGIQVAKALEHAHGIGIIHRDIKPANLLLQKDGVVKVADLGLAKNLREAGTSGITADGMAIGTPNYMPPEQVVDARSVDHRADIYALGATLHHALTGEVPFASKNVLEIASRVLNEDLPSPRDIVETVPDSLCMVVERMTLKDPRDRYDQMSEVLSALEAIRAELG
ncbi:MAG: serine/threonine protein kinase [Planctomycetes bacterium]|nr:serine/threonine protein kinase [Planctomycetota bacterium]